MCVCLCVLFVQSCPSLCEPMDCRLLGSSAHGILQTRILEWVAIPFSRGSSQPRDQTQVSCIEGRFFTVWATRVGEINDFFLGSCPIFCPPDLSDYWYGFWRHWCITIGNRSGGSCRLSFKWWQHIHSMQWHSSQVVSKSVATALHLPPVFFINIKASSTLCDVFIKACHQAADFRAVL